MGDGLSALLMGTFSVASCLIEGKMDLTLSFVLGST